MRPVKFVIYLGNATRLGQPRLYYWRIRAPNGKLIADGSEGYATRANCRRAVNRLLQAIDFGAAVEYDLRS